MFCWGQPGGCCRIGRAAGAASGAWLGGGVAVAERAPAGAAGPLLRPGPAGWALLSRGFLAGEGGQGGGEVAAGDGLAEVVDGAVNVHSPDGLGMPRTLRRRMPMLCLMSPWGVSAMWPRCGRRRCRRRWPGGRASPRWAGRPSPPVAGGGGAGGFFQVAALAGGDQPVRAGAGEVGLGAGSRRRPGPGRSSPVRRGRAGGGHHERRRPSASAIIGSNHGRRRGPR